MRSAPCPSRTGENEDNRNNLLWHKVEKFRFYAGAGHKTDVLEAAAIVFMFRVEQHIAFDGGENCNICS